MRWLVALLVVANILIFALGRDEGPAPGRVEVPARPEVGNLKLLSEVGADRATAVPPDAAEAGQTPVSTPAQAPSSPADAGGPSPVAAGQAPSGETAVEGSANE